MAPPNDNPNGYYVESFPAPGLRQIVRHITGLNEQGDSVFLHSDHGDHHRFMVQNQAISNLLYSTQETPVDLNNNVDIQKAKEKEVCFPIIPPPYPSHPTIFPPFQGQAD